MICCSNATAKAAVGTLIAGISTTALDGGGSGGGEDNSCVTGATAAAVSAVWVKAVSNNCAKSVDAA